MASTIRPNDIVNSDSGDQALMLDVREQFTKARSDIDLLNSAVIYAEARGVVADGVTDNADALDALLDYVDSLGGGVIAMPTGVIRTTRQWTWGNGSNSQPSQKHHRIFLLGKGIGASAAYTNVQGQGVTVIRYDGSTDTNAAVLEFAGPLLNVGYQDIEFDANSKAGTGVRTIHVANSRFVRPCVKNWTTLALDFTTRTGFPAGCAYGCADNLLVQPYVMEPTNFTGNGIRLTSGVNTANTLIGNPDTARLIVDGGTIFYGGNAGSIGCLVHGADNNTMRRTLIIQKGGSTGAGVGLELRQWSGSTTFPLENRFEDVVPLGGILGPGGTLGNWIILPTSDGATVTNRGDIVVEQYDGKTHGTQPYVRADASGRGLRFEDSSTVIGAILRRTNDVRITATSGNFVVGANTSTESGGNDDLTVLPSEARVRVPGAGNGFTGYSGSTHLFSFTRDSNDAKVSAFGNVKLVSGATSGPTGGTVVGEFSTTSAKLLGAVAVPAGGTTGTGITVSSTSNLGVFFGSGAPTLSAAQGSLYLRTDGSSTSTRLYVNTNGSTGWTNVTTAT